MESPELYKLRYPIGNFVPPENISGKQWAQWIDDLQGLPQDLRDLVAPLTEDGLDTPYRPGGWTVRQVVHHLSDSHHNCYLRLKWALTEDNPLIKAYDEKAWAELFDSRTAPVQGSLDHLRAVHAKLVYLIKGLSKGELKRKFTHPVGLVECSLEETVGRYAWHGRHHLAHITNLMEREGW